MSAPGYRFDAFISYKHGVVSGFSKTLKHRLERYGRPFLAPSRSIFRDEDYVTADCHLPAVIQKALDRSRYFVLLASPEAASSPWVEREVSHWCKSPERLDRIIIVLAAGAIVNDEHLEIDWSATSSLPLCLQKHLSAIPYYVDMRWASEEADLALEHTHVKSAINNIVAKLENVTPEVMLGAEANTLRQNQRRAKRIAGVMAVLALAAGVGWIQTARSLRREEAARLAAESESRRHSGRTILDAGRAARAALNRSDDPSLLEVAGRALAMLPERRVDRLLPSLPVEVQVTATGKYVALLFRGAPTQVLDTAKALPQTLAANISAITPYSGRDGFVFSVGSALYDWLPESAPVPVLGLGSASDDAAIGSIVVLEGDRYAVAAAPGQLFLCDLKKRLVVRRYAFVCGESSFTLHGSPQGTFVALACGDERVVWAIKDETLTLLEEIERTTDFAFSPDGQSFAAIVDSYGDLERYAWQNGEWRSDGTLRYQNVGTLVARSFRLAWTSSGWAYTTELEGAPIATAITRRNRGPFGGVQEGEDPVRLFRTVGGRSVEAGYLPSVTRWGFALDPAMVWTVRDVRFSVWRNEAGEGEASTSVRTLTLAPDRETIIVETGLGIEVLDAWTGIIRRPESRSFDPDKSVPLATRVACGGRSMAIAIIHAISDGDMQDDELELLARCDRGGTTSGWKTLPPPWVRGGDSLTIEALGDRFLAVSTAQDGWSFYDVASQEKLELSLVPQPRAAAIEGNRAVMAGGSRLWHVTLPVGAPTWSVDAPEAVQRLEWIDAGAEVVYSDGRSLFAADSATGRLRGAIPVEGATWLTRPSSPRVVLSFPDGRIETWEPTRGRRETIVKTDGPLGALLLPIVRRLAAPLAASLARPFDHVAIDAEGSHFAGSAGGDLEVWDLTRGDMVARFFHTAPITGLAIEGPLVSFTDGAGRVMTRVWSRREVGQRLEHRLATWN